MVNCWVGKLSSSLDSVTTIMLRIPSTIFGNESNLLLIELTLIWPNKIRLGFLSFKFLSVMSGSSRLSDVLSKVQSEGGGGEGGGGALL